jgi:hypothetical protein
LGGTSSRCAPCNKDLNLEKPIARILHNSAHILNDSRFPRSRQPCALCLRKDDQCIFYIKYFRKAWHIDLENSSCPMRSDFKFGVAGTASASNPSTNVLLECKFCRPKTRGIWRYNFERHLRDEHNMDPEQYTDIDWDLAPGEKAAMQAIWQNHGNFKKRVTQKSNTKALSVSESHKTAMVFRCVNFRYSPRSK